MAKPLIYQFHALTDTGRVRAQNEDAVAVHPSHGLALLADGMGGYNAGEVASTMAIEHLGAQLSAWFDEHPPVTAAAASQALQACVQDANQAILAAAQTHPQYDGMGTTLVVAWLHDDWLLLGHIGDSRCYRLRQGRLQQLTRDHSWLQEQIDIGLLTPQEAALSGQRNLVTRALGVENRVEAEINEFAVEAADLYLLCSDGLTDLMQHQELQELAAQDVPLAEKAQRMVNLANALGGRDNISVVLVQAAAAPASAPAPRPGLAKRLLRKGR
ncbi:Stp1/IreP family PP2C-type Ser/Thr phosphatase [Melaminivora sp.]